MKPILPLFALLALTGCARSQPAPAVMPATLTAKDVPPCPKPAAPGLVIDTYEKGAYFGAFHDPKSAFTAEVALYADGSGHFLFGAYTVAPGGYAGLWGVPGEQWNHKQDWARAKSITFDAFSSRPMTFSFTFKGDEGKKYSGSTSTTQGGVWQQLSLPVSLLSDIASQIGLIGGFDLNVGAGGESGQFAIDNLVVDGGAEPQTGDNGQPLELRASVIFAKTLTPPAARSHKIYVVDGANGADTNTGTAQKPFASIQRAADIALPGDTVLVKNGTYVTLANPRGEAAVVTRSGAPGFPITFKAAPGAHPVLGGINIREAAYVTLDGFIVTTDLPQLSAEARKERYGVGLDHAHHVRVANCAVHNCGGGGIGSGFCDYVTVENNTVHDTAFSSIYNGSGISLWENRALDEKPGPHCVVRGNVCYRNENRGPTPLYGGELTDGNGIILDWQRGVAPVLIENNVCYDNGGRGIHVFHAKGVVVRHNTLVGNERTHSAKGCDLRANTSKDVQFVDNIVVGRAGQSFTPNYLPKNVTYTHNLFYNYVSVDPDGQSAGNIVDQDPQFANSSLDPKSADFRLRHGSPAAGLGAADTVTQEAAR